MEKCVKQSIIEKFILIFEKNVSMYVSWTQDIIYKYKLTFLGGCTSLQSMTVGDRTVDEL